MRIGFRGPAVLLGSTSSSILGLLLSTPSLPWELSLPFPTLPTARLTRHLTRASGALAAAAPCALPLAVADRLSVTAHGALQLGSAQCAAGMGVPVAHTVCRIGLWESHLVLSPATACATGRSSKVAARAKSFGDRVLRIRGLVL